MNFANIFQLLIGLATIAADVAVKNPQHQATVEKVLTDLTVVMGPIAQQMAQQNPPKPQ